MSKLVIEGIKVDLNKIWVHCFSLEAFIDLEFMKSKNGSFHRSWDPKCTLESIQPVSTSAGLI